jgi:tRNA pseudouridine38-40 synthase
MACHAGSQPLAQSGHNRHVRSARLALRLAYLGGSFAGWQRQPAARTVQGVLEQTLERLYRRPVRIVGAGRTDAGVHAGGQVAHFDPPHPIPAAGVAAALNTMLPPDVRVLSVRRVTAAFDARRSARGKVYRYRFAWGTPLPPWEELRRWHLAHPLDIRRMAAVLPSLAGEHDFAAFALSGHAGHGARGTVRTVRLARLHVRGRRLDLLVEGDGFLRGMVRRLAGALVEVGRTAQDRDWLAALLAGEDVRPAAPSAPAHGLTLERVLY